VKRLPEETANFGLVEDSVRDLTRIYKPSNPDLFVKEYIRKYRIPKGNEVKLKSFVLDELKKMKAADKQ
jgi:hypothetical protein